MHIAMDIAPYFEIADSDRTYDEKLTAYEKLADAHLETEQFHEFCGKHLVDLDETTWNTAQTPEFDAILVQTVRTYFPEHEHEQFIAHFRGLLTHWIEAEAAQFQGS